MHAAEAADGGWRRLYAGHPVLPRPRSVRQGAGGWGHVLRRPAGQHSPAQLQLRGADGPSRVRDAEPGPERLRREVRRRQPLYGQGPMQRPLYPGRHHGYLHSDTERLGHDALRGLPAVQARGGRGPYRYDGPVPGRRHDGVYRGGGASHQGRGHHRLRQSLGDIWHPERQLLRLADRAGGLPLPGHLGHRGADSAAAAVAGDG